MLPGALRLRAAEVREVMQKGKSLRGQYVSAKLQTVGGTVCRSAAVVSKKIAKTAVRRNSVRRALYTALHTTHPSRGSHVVWIVHTLPPKPMTKAFAADIETICSKHFS